MQIHAYQIRHANGWGTGTGPRPTHCAECGDTLTGNDYGIDPNEADVTGAFAADVLGGEAYRLKKGERVTMSRATCYECCGRGDVASMKATGRATLYLKRAHDLEQLQHTGTVPRAAYRVTNWPGTLAIPCHSATHSRGGFGSQRTDVWFTGPDGARWHGVNRGDNQLLRCKRLKGAK